MKHTYLNIFIIGVALLGSAWIEADNDVKILSIAEILKQRASLHRAIVGINGQINWGKELISISDDSKCSHLEKRPCRISFALGACRVSGAKFHGESCRIALDRFVEQYSLHLSGQYTVVIENVRIIGLLLTRREDLSYEKSVPMGGFGHLGVFAAELRATQIDLDNAVVN